jgi:hypothetical protein
MPSIFFFWGDFTGVLLPVPVGVAGSRDESTTPGGAA